MYLIEQADILNELVGILYNGISDKFSQFICELSYEEEFGALDLSMYTMDGGLEGKYYIDLPVGLPSKAIDVVEKLYKLMESHTGVAWTSMILTLDAEGKATAKFNYPDPADG